MFCNYRGFATLRLNQPRDHSSGHGSAYDLNMCHCQQCCFSGIQIPKGAFINDAKQVGGGGGVVLLWHYV